MQFYLAESNGIRFRGTRTKSLILVEMVYTGVIADWGPVIEPFLKQVIFETLPTVDTEETDPSSFGGVAHLAKLGVRVIDPERPSVPSEQLVPVTFDSFVTEFGLLTKPNSPLAYGFVECPPPFKNFVMVWRLPLSPGVLERFRRC